MVRAPRSHRGGRRFKSSIAHQLEGTWEPWASARTPRAEVAEWQTRCVQGAVSLRMCGFKSLPRHQTAPRACSSEDRALPCGGRGREFESRQARHFLSCFWYALPSAPLVLSLSKGATPSRTSAPADWPCPRHRRSPASRYRPGALPRTSAPWPTVRRPGCRG